MSKVHNRNIVLGYAKISSIFGVRNLSDLIFFFLFFFFLEGGGVQSRCWGPAYVAQ